MGENSAISWTDATFNPWVGCAKVSPACDACYAENLMATRYGRVKWGGPGSGVGTRERTSQANWRKPLAWNRKAAADGTRPFVFCASLADVFDNAVDPAWRADLFELIWATPNLTWLLLTKRPSNIVALFNQALQMTTDEWGPGLAAAWPRNAAIGCTVVTQAEANRDVPALLAAKATLNPAFAFVSMEPLLGPVDLAEAWHGETALDAECWGDCAWCKTGYPPLHNCQMGKGRWEDGRSGLDWVITGGETDQGPHKARPSHPDWFRSLRDQCASAGVAYHHKQNGEWQGYGAAAPTDPRGNLGLPRAPTAHHDFPDGETVFRVGKKAAGRMLDGVEHNARPAFEGAQHAGEPREGVSSTPSLPKTPSPPG